MVIAGQFETVPDTICVVQTSRIIYQSVVIPRNHKPRTAILGRHVLDQGQIATIEIEPPVVPACSVVAQFGVGDIVEKEPKFIQVCTGQHRHVLYDEMNRGAPDFDPVSGQCLDGQITNEIRVARGSIPAPAFGSRLRGEVCIASNEYVGVEIGRSWYFGRVGLNGIGFNILIRASPRLWAKCYDRGSEKQKNANY